MSNGEHKTGRFVEFMLAIVVMMGGAMTYLYLQDRQDWAQERRQHEVDMKLLEVQMTSIRMQMDHILKANELTNTRIDKVWQKYDELRERMRR